MSSSRLPYVSGFARRGAEEPGVKAAGKALREAVPRSAHRGLAFGAERPGAVAAVEESSAGRIPELIPIRVGRMAASPFAFLRGSAGLMAHDLMSTPVTGIAAQICGDAHAANFGLYADARGRLMIDLNDFDETLRGPWEWDLKRLATSLVLAGREAGVGEDVCREAARDVTGAYRRTMRLLARMPAFDAWHAIVDEDLVSHVDARDLAGTLRRVMDKARKNTSARFAAKATEVVPDADTTADDDGAMGTADGRGGVLRRFVDAPPVLRRVPDAEAAAVVSSLGGYLRTLPDDRLPLLSRYAVHDVAFRVVGTGSVGLRSYVVLLVDPRGEPLVLQVKEVRGSVLAPYVQKAGFEAAPVEHEARRVVLGQKRMQVVSDTLLGWTTVYATDPAASGCREGLPFQVRQFRNRKGSVDPAALPADELDDYARMTGALLARAHAHSVDPRLVAGYCGKSEALDDAVAAFAVAYADRTEADHAELVAAVRNGRMAAEPGV
ncbi:DUF2252 domain-containing protein [Streptomyces niger]|uniref:DUF2252 domain-containing protein n=1 Tax=Streptomyces niger TaxID=66373 RepID=UPI00069A91B2|nr:DUF2252 domain-containing protein [Streptomyces niger]